MRAGFFAVAGALVALAASGGSCQFLGGLTTPTPTPLSGFPKGAKLTGRFLFKQQTPPNYLVARHRVAGGLEAQEAATSDADGFFYFLTPGTGSFQVIWDDGGDIVRDTGINTMGYYVSGPLPALEAAADRTKPQITMDLYWEPALKPAPGGKFDGKFGFEKIPDLASVSYFVTIFNVAKEALVDTATASGGPIAWDRKDRKSEALPAGKYLYKVKFVEAGEIWGGFSFFGSTKFVEFRLD
jgi:hypothetical protein